MRANVDLIHRIFIERDYKWSVGGRLSVPSKEDIRTCLDRMADVLDDGDIGMNINVGRLHMEKTEGGLETYIWMGFHERL